MFNLLSNFRFEFVCFSFGTWMEEFLKSLKIRKQAGEFD